MTHLRIELADDKNIRLTGVDPLLAGCLVAVPQILAQRDRPPARQRLYPDPFRADAPANEEWHRLMDDELRHLFAAAGEIVERDLTRLAPDPARERHLQLLVPVAHLNAWLSALNQARLILAEQYVVTEADMANEQLDPGRAKDVAVFQIHVLGWLLQLLVEYAGGAAA